MNRRCLLTLLALMPLALSGCASTGAAIDNSKIGKLANSLGLTTEQAQAGLGAMLKLAQFRLDPAAYARIADVIPRADEYMALAGRLDAFQGATPSAAGLNGAFGKLGFSPDQAAKFVPALTDYVSKAASPEAGMTFAKSLQ